MSSLCLSALWEIVIMSIVKMTVGIMDIVIMTLPHFMASYLSYYKLLILRIIKFSMYDPKIEKQVIQSYMYSMWCCFWNCFTRVVTIIVIIVVHCDFVFLFLLILKLMLGSWSGVFLWVQIQKVSQFSHADARRTRSKVYLFEKSQGP